MFKNRKMAGVLLAEELDRYFVQQDVPTHKSNYLVVGLPRGGLPVALEVARHFKCSLDIIASQKLPYPGQPEYGIGAVTADGICELNPNIPNEPEWRNYVEQQSQRLLNQTLMTERKFHEASGLPPASFANKTVIVVDDGIATGMTAMAALETARHRGAQRIIMAAPVISADAYDEMRDRCYEVVAVIVPELMGSVGQYYVDFRQTSDEEVVNALRLSKQFITSEANNKAS